MNKKILTSGGLLMAIALLIAVNIVSNTSFKSMRLDLTENRLYTLSDGTRNILKSLEEPISLRFFLSQKLATSLPGISNYSVRVRELLEEYRRAAGGKIKLMIIDPEPFSEAEDSAEGYGLQGIPVNKSNTRFYFGLVGTNSTDDEDTIPFFSPNREEFLEYDLTKLVYQLVNPKQKVVGIMSTLPIQGAKDQNPLATNDSAWMIVDQIRKVFKIRTIATDVKEIEDDIDILMLVHPKDLSDATLYAIDQFVLKGGKAIVFADPYSEAYQPPSNPNNPFAAAQAPRNSDLKKLFDAWGIELVSEKVVGDLENAQRVQIRKGKRAMVVNYPIWMKLNAEQHFNKEDIVTGKLDNMVIASPGSLVKKDDAEIELIPLIESGEKAMQIGVDKLGLFAEPDSLERDFKAEGKFVLAARITGKVKTAFPDGKPDSDDEDDGGDEKTDSNHVKESAESINLIIVADTDMLEDKYWVRVQRIFGQRISIPHAANATFVSNALDNLSGSNDLISVRNRGSFNRPFTKVEEIQRQAELRFRDKEKELQARLEETQQKINSLQTQKQKGNQFILSVEQQQEIASFREEKIKIRKELRNVQHELQKDIERLETQMKFFNIGAMPLLIGMLGITLSVWSRKRRRRLQPVKG